MYDHGSFLDLVRCFFSFYILYSVFFLIFGIDWLFHFRFHSVLGNCRDIFSAKEFVNDEIAHFFGSISLGWVIYVKIVFRHFVVVTIACCDGCGCRFFLHSQWNCFGKWMACNLHISFNSNQMQFILFAVQVRVFFILFLRLVVILIASVRLHFGKKKSGKNVVFAHSWNLFVDYIGSAYAFKRSWGFRIFCYSCVFACGNNWLTFKEFGFGSMTCAAVIFVVA